MPPTKVVVFQWPCGTAAKAALTPACAAIAARHLGRRAAFIDEDQALGIEVGLGVEPGFAPGGYVRPILLGGVCRLFFRVKPWRLKKPWTTLVGGR